MSKAESILKLVEEAKAREDAAAAPKNEMRSVKVTTADGYSWVTSVNGTDDEIKDYFKIGEPINVGDGPEDNMKVIHSVDIDPEDSSEGVTRYPTTKSPSDPTYSKEWSGVTGAPKAKGLSCSKCGGDVHKEAGSHYCPSCDDYVSVNKKNESTSEEIDSLIAGASDLKESELVEEVADLLIGQESEDLSTGDSIIPNPGDSPAPGELSDADADDDFDSDFDPIQFFDSVMKESLPKRDLELEADKLLEGLL